MRAIVVLTINLSLALHIVLSSEWQFSISPGNLVLFLMTLNFFNQDIDKSFWLNYHERVCFIFYALEWLLSAYLFFNCAKPLLYRLSSVIITRLMLNLRDPTFISASLAENTTCPDLTFVESQYPTQLSYRSEFEESEPREGDEQWSGEDPYVHRPAGKHFSFLFTFSFWFVCGCLIPLNFLLGDDIELRKRDVWLCQVRSDYLSIES